MGAENELQLKHFFPATNSLDRWWLFSSDCPAATTASRALSSNRDPNLVDVVELQDDN